MVKISPSILACDAARLGEEVECIRKAGAEMAHLDIMDGMFVSNMSFGFPMVEALRRATEMFLDVHLMIVKPERYIERFIDAGADLITFHLEATDIPDECIEMIKKKGKKAAISIKPATPASAAFPYLEKCDMILVMTVEPGYGGQALIPYTLDKVRQLKEERERRGLSFEIEVDGGINEETAAAAIEAGADVMVAGSAVFGKSDYKQAIDVLKNA